MKHFYEFGPFRVDVEERLLLRAGEVVPLTPKVFDVLLVLVQNPGHILEKEEVMNAVWPDSNVEEANLTRNVSTLRKALGETANDHPFIETIPWRGYRFVATVSDIREETPKALIVTQPPADAIIEEPQPPASVEVRPAV